MQTITIAGKLGRDAELRNTQNGDSVLGFTVAVDVRNGREKATNWWRVSLWGKRGEALAPYLLKGVAVTVIGEFSLGEYDGKPQLNIRASEIALQGGRSEQRQQSTGNGSRTYSKGQEGHLAGFDDEMDDSVPFAHCLPIDNVKRRVI